MESIIKGIYTDILEGNHKTIQTKIQSAIQAGIKPSAILQEGMIVAMSEVGRLFETGEYYVPEMLVAARAMQTGLAVLKPQLVAAQIQPVGKIAIGTVTGDLHDIGKNLVSMMLEGAGFENIDLGPDAGPEKFIDAVTNHDVEILALSALLTTTMPNMKVIIDALIQAGLRQRVKIIIGGAPVTQNYAQAIGADGYAPDASRAVSLAKSLL